ncbi:MAG: HD domain-containing protein [Deltaproteobacteria bacterium]|nr:HD domain-containing protein [Deltaproteobacteria bacterium]
MTKLGYEHHKISTMENANQEALNAIQDAARETLEGFFKHLAEPSGIPDEAYIAVIEASFDVMAMFPRDKVPETDSPTEREAIRKAVQEAFQSALQSRFMDAVKKTDQELAAAGSPSPETSYPPFRLADFLFEAAALKRTPRTGYQFLGRGHENVAEHSFGSAMVAFVLGRVAGEKVDQAKLMAMALLHDLAEARTGDLNYVNKRYVAADEDAAFRDAIKGLPFEEELAAIWAEWRKGESLEARLARDADQIDMMLELKRLSAHGWSQADEWLGYAGKRITTEPGKKLGMSVIARGPDDWWFEKRDELWVNPKSPGPDFPPPNQAPLKSAPQGPPKPCHGPCGPQDGPGPKPASGPPEGAQEASGKEPKEAADIAADIAAQPAPKTPGK